MSYSYLSAKQVKQLLTAINPRRVSKREGMSHLEAYDVRAHLTRIFGFGRWSADLIDLTELYEQISEKTNKDKTSTWEVVSVGYRATMRLTINAPDGTLLATYTEAAAGSATNFPITKRADAADFAIKTAESQALKRCAMNLGDQFGLSLYEKGKQDALVKRTFVMPEGDGAGEDVTHDVERVVPEAAEEEHAPSAQATSANTSTVTPPVESPAPAAPVSASPDEVEAQQAAEAQHLRDRAIAAAKDGKKNLPELAKINLAAGRAKLMNAPVRAENGEQMTLGVLIDTLIRGLSRNAA